jgi:acetate kinase
MTMSPQAKTDALLVLNAGSSSLKFAVFALTGQGLVQRHDGQMEGIGAAPRFMLCDATGAKLAERSFTEAEAPKDHQGALGVILQALKPLIDGATIRAIGHRVVHGGRDLSAPVLITPAIMAQLRALVPLAPLHQPHNLAGIEAAALRLSWPVLRIYRPPPGRRGRSAWPSAVDCRASWQWRVALRH